MGSFIFSNFFSSPSVYFYLYKSYHLCGLCWMALIINLTRQPGLADSRWLSPPPYLVENYTPLSLRPVKVDVYIYFDKSDGLQTDVNKSEAHNYPF